MRASPAFDSQTVPTSRDRCTPVLGRALLFGRVVRAGVRAALALSAAACVTVHGYEGPDRPPAEVATIAISHPDFDSPFEILLALAGSWETRVVAVDALEIVTRFPGDEVAVLPGRHKVVASLEWTDGQHFHDYGTYLAYFDAVAGTSYELRGHGPLLGSPVGFEVWDAGANAFVASSDARAEECVTARLAWEGRPWPQADWGRTGELTTTICVPLGQVLSSWRELVELQYRPWRGKSDLLEVMRSQCEDLEKVCDDASQTVVESEPGLLVFTWSIVDSGGGTQQGVTCLRSGPRGCHVLTYAVRGMLEPEVETTWTARFKAAQLLPPED